ncbi:MAG: biotin--[acetyl-CoA-carboxylase] ligase [Saprospiraceae bacterium]|nr:biotin--[acetyl-CoA-carboxylase] ligase [Saprospiraceae bacterium]
MSNSNTLFIGKVLLEFPALPSTNLFALELLSKSKPTEGTVISASDQTDGRGQIGSKWLGEPGKNIALSIILYPFFLKATRQFSLSQAIALAVRDWAQEILEKKIHLKWPNDLYIGHRKAGGILIQNSILGQTLQSSVVGIGINVNQKNFDESLPNPTSFCIESNGLEFDLEMLKDRLYQHIEQRYLQLKNGQMDALAAAYHECLYGLGVNLGFERQDGSVFRGVITGTTPSGLLCIRDEYGTEAAFDLKAVRFLTGNQG